MKKYNFNSKQIVDHLKANPLTADEKKSLIMSESEVYKALGVKQSDIADDKGYLREDVDVQFDDDKLVMEEQELLYHVAAAMAKYGKENISTGEWDVHCYDGNVLAWNSSIYTPNFC